MRGTGEEASGFEEWITRKKYMEEMNVNHVCHMFNVILNRVQVRLKISLSFSRLQEHSTWLTGRTMRLPLAMGLKFNTYKLKHNKKRMMGMQIQDGREKCQGSKNP